MNRFFIATVSTLLIASSFPAFADTCETMTYHIGGVVHFKVRPNSTENWSNGVSSLAEAAEEVQMLADAGLCSLPESTCEVLTHNCHGGGICYQIRANKSHEWKYGFSDITSIANLQAHIGSLCRPDITPCQIINKHCISGTCYQIRAKDYHEWSNKIFSISEFVETLKFLKNAKFCS